MIDSRLAKNLHNLEKIFFFLTVLFLPTQLGKHFWPSFSLVYSLRIDYLSPTVYFWDLLIFLLVLIQILRLLIKDSQVKINQRAAIVFSFFLLTQFSSILFALNPGAGLVRGKDYLTASFFGLYLASANFANIRKSFMTGLLIAVIFSCFLAVSQFLAGNSLGFWILGERSLNITMPLIAKFNFYDRVFLRPYATFSHPNILAGFLAVALPLILSGLNKSLPSFKMVLSLLIFSTVFITFSRPGVILISFYLMVLYRRSWKLLAIIAALIAPLAFVRFSSIFTFDSLAVLRRQELSEFAVRLFLTHPVFGVGLNNFINSLASSEVLVGTSRFLQPVHNIFLLNLSETGIAGFIGFAVMIVSGLIANFKKVSLFNKAISASLLTVIFLGLFDHYFLTLPQGQRLFFMIIGLSLMASGKNKAKT